MWGMIATRVANAIKFRYVLTDSWFAAKENFEFILKKGKHFISAQKDCCLLALTGRRQENDALLCTDQSVGIGRSSNGARLVERLPGGSAFHLRKLYKQRQLLSPVESGMQRFGVRRQTSGHDLSKR
jgi:hypothetical protein